MFFFDRAPQSAYLFIPPSLYLIILPPSTLAWPLSSLAFGSIADPPWYLGWVELFWMMSNREWRAILLRPKHGPRPTKWTSKWASRKQNLPPPLTPFLNQSFFQKYLILGFGVRKPKFSPLPTPLNCPNSTRQCAFILGNTPIVEMCELCAAHFGLLSSTNGQFST